MSVVKPVPYLDLVTQFKQLEGEWLETIKKTGAAGSFILGPNVTAFEQEFAKYCGVKHAIGVANGTDSLILSLRSAQSDEDYCQDMNPVGFILAYQDQNGVRELHADGDVLPKSRGCTLDYRIYAVVEPFSEYYGDGFTSRRVAIIATYPFGFEGVDRRFLAVPIDK